VEDLTSSKRQLLDLRTGLVRVPPHSIEAEQGVLGCLILDAKASLCACRLSVSVEDFYDLRHKEIYLAICELVDSNTIVDLITLSQKLKDNQKLEASGGLGYLASLSDAVPSASNMPYYVQIVRSKADLRRIILVCSETISKAYETENSEEAISQAERGVLSVRRKDVKSEESIKALITQALDHIEFLSKSDGKVTGVSTGFPDLDAMTDGMHSDEMLIIAGYPGSGKTALAADIANHVAVNLEKPVGIFSLEMSGKSIVTRMLASRARVDLHKIRRHGLTERDYSNISIAAGKLSKAGLHFETRSDLTIFELRSVARRMKAEHNIGLVVIDYLQLLSAGGGARRPDSRQEEVTEISRQIKAMTRELEIPVIALSQLNDEGKLRESRAIGQDADSIWMLKAEETEGTVPEEGSTQIKLMVKKNRNGPVGNVDLVFLKQFTKFESSSRGDYD